MKIQHTYTFDKPLMIIQNNYKFRGGKRVRSFYFTQVRELFGDKYTVAIFKIKWKQ